MVGLMILAAFAILSLLSLAYGVDSRDESADPHRPVYPIGLR